MQLDYQQCRRLINSARSTAVDGTLLAKSSSQQDKERKLQLVMGDIKAKMKQKECIIVVLTTP